MEKKKEVVVLVGAGAIGQAIARRVGAGRHVVLGDLKKESADAAAQILVDAGFETSTVAVDISSRDSILALIEHAQDFGPILNVINAAGVSPSQAPVEAILKVDLYGTAVVLEEFGKIIAKGGSGVVISSQSGHRLGALSEEENTALATTPTEELLGLPMLKSITDTLKAYQYSKRCNVLRVMYEHHHHAVGESRAERSAGRGLPYHAGEVSCGPRRNTGRGGRAGRVPDVETGPLHLRQ